MKATKLLIGDEWVDADSGSTGETIKPATGEVIATFADAAAAATRSGFETDVWQAMRFEQGGKKPVERRGAPRGQRGRDRGARDVRPPGVTSGLPRAARSNAEVHRATTGSATPNPSEGRHR